jgi:hypothetical protein
MGAGGPTLYALAWAVLIALSALVLWRRHVLVS